MAAAGQVALISVMANKKEAAWGWVSRVEARQPGFEAAVDALRRLAPEVPSERVWSWWGRMLKAQIQRQGKGKGQAAP